MKISWEFSKDWMVSVDDQRQDVGENRVDANPHRDVEIWRLSNNTGWLVSSDPPSSD